MQIMTPTPAQLSTLRHILGTHKRFDLNPKLSRNYYADGDPANWPKMEAMIALGLVAFVRLERAGSDLFRVYRCTPAGIEAPEPR